MSVRISAAAAKVVALDLKQVLRPDPSLTTWARLEPLPTSDDVQPGLQAPVADPLWFLARQWQFNEFQGEDAGSPVGASLRVQGVPLRELRHPQGAVPPQVLDGSAPPLEALVEGERVLGAHPKLNAQAGQHLQRLLRAAGQAAVADTLRERYAAPLPDPADAVADNAGFVWHQLLDARAIDAQRLADDWRAVQGADAPADGFVAGLGLAGPAVAAVRSVLDAWLRWLADLAYDPGTHGASPYWNAQRQEYAFSLGSTANPPLELQAREYTDGRLDWHSFTLPATVPTADALFANAAIQWSPRRPPMPTVARYPGMPADRYWEFEDGRVNFGRLGAAKSDLARLALMEYALVYGNDWFTLPVTLPVNAFYRVAHLQVRDNFGEVVNIPPATTASGQPWTMFELSQEKPASPTAPRARFTEGLFLCPASHALTGAPLEQVLLMRDEMANIAWAIEQKVQGTSGEPLDRRFESTRLATTQVLRAPAGAPAAAGLPLHYTLQTPVAPNWIPFLPVKREQADEAHWNIQLQRGVVVQHYQVAAAGLADARNAEYAAVVARLQAAPFVEALPPAGPAANPLQGFAFHPRGELLRLNPADDGQLFTHDYLRLEDEEVPRDGVKLQRAFNYARDAAGHAVLWIGRSKSTGRGEGGSGLRFDAVRKAGASRL